MRVTVKVCCIQYSRILSRKTLSKIILYKNFQVILSVQEAFTFMSRQHLDIVPENYVNDISSSRATSLKSIVYSIFLRH